MPIVQNLYKIFKLPASIIVKNNCALESPNLYNKLRDDSIVTIGEDEFRVGDIVVSIGDNLVFQQLRYIHGDTRDHKELFTYVSKLRNNMHLYKKQGQYRKANILEQHISEMLFVKDIINIVVDGKKTDFHKFRTSGFTVNGVRYVYLCSGSGQIRRNTATFVNEAYHDTLVKILNCGLDTKTSEFVLAKYSAYFALAFSSILWVRTPRVCVIKDFFNILPKENVDFITHDETGKAYIEERQMDLELNCADGQGLIDPEFSKLWAEDMSLSYVPCSFVARSCFVKGNLVTFDFREYAKAHGITEIRDRWGISYPIDEIDVLLSESQFKTAKYYNSWQEYSKFAQEGNIHWGVARYTKRDDAEYTLTNYQYIQALSLSESDIQNLIAPTVSWLKDVCSGDPLASMLFLFGNKSERIQYGSLYAEAQTPITKALIKNIGFLEDTYVQQKIYNNIAEAIDHAKVGKIWVHGNYQFMISDPVAQCQSALGLPVTGILKRDEVWSKFWVDRFRANPSKKPIIDTCRSPMIDQHEHNPMNVAVDNEEASIWLGHLYSGIVYNIYDTSCFRHEDSDYDGDIVLGTDNEYFIKGAHKDHNIITYEKGLAVPAKMTIPNITATVAKGFGSGVGGFSNIATILYSMAPMFDKPGREDQHAEIMLRIKLLREIVGQEIDRIKGADKPSLPKEWKTPEKILPTDSQDEVIRKLRVNSMVIKKKPYFFRYLYPELNQRFKEFEFSYNQVSRDTFGIKFKKLLVKEDKTEEERDLIRKYQKYSPLITTPCTMNNLCRAMEDVDFDIKFSKDKNGNKKKPAPSLLPTFSEEYDASFSEDRLAFVKDLYRQYSSRKQMTHLHALSDILYSDPSVHSDEIYDKYYKSSHDALISSLQLKLEENEMSGKEFLFYCSRLAPKYKSFNWGFAWNVLGDQIIKLIPRGESYCPIRDPEGEYSCLGTTYSLKDLTPDSDDEIQNVIDTVTHLDDERVPDEELLNSIIESASNTKTLEDGENI